MENNQKILAQAGTAIGVGLMAGLVGTAAVTLTKKLDKKCSERKSEKAMLEVAAKVLDVKPTSVEKTDKVVEEIHWAYGAGMGAVRGALCFLGIRGVLGTAAHFATIWYTEKMLLPDMKKVFPDVEGAKQINEEKKEAVARESLHQGVYALVTGLVFDIIMPKNKKKE